MLTRQRFLPGFLPAAASRLGLALLAAACLTGAPARGQMSFEQPPIDYLKTPVHDPVARLQKKLDQGQAHLRYGDRHGYLRSVLASLDIPISSQVLVFSKTSFQLKRITPRSPRAVYFGPNVYVGWVQNGDVLEVSSVDPDQGAIFYTLSQRESAAPKFTRRTHECLQCHGSSLTHGVPGHLVRSLYVGPDGHPILAAGTFLTDQSSPLKQRWGGWYVTGQHGSQRHLGNLVVQADDDLEHLDIDAGANAHDLSQWCETAPYLGPHSDIVALLVLEHQTQMHNLITQANFVTRVALRDQQVMNEMLERPKDYRSESTNRRIERAGEPLVAYMLFSGETKLTDRIQGTSAFDEEFVAGGISDLEGRSLRELDLTKRLFKYPCSYLVYSEAFEHLPEPVTDYVYRRLWEVLTGKDTTEAFAHLSSTDRHSILQILRQTKPGLPEYWEEGS